MTLGSPLWYSCVKEKQWNKLGDATGFLVVVDCTLIFLQLLLTPFLLVLQLGLCFIPLCLGIFLFSPTTDVR